MTYKDIFSEKTLGKLNRQSAENLKKVIKGKTLEGTLIETSQLLNQIINIEKPYISELQKLAIYIVEDLYPLINDNNIIIDAAIEYNINEVKIKSLKPFNVEYWYRANDEKEIDVIKVQADNKEEAIEIAKQKARKSAIKSSFSIIKENINESDAETNRRIINGITQGAALRNTFAFYLFKEHLDDINPELVGKYQSLMDNVFGIYDDDNAIAMFLSQLSMGMSSKGGSSEVIINEIKINRPKIDIFVEEEDEVYIDEDKVKKLLNPKTLLDINLVDLYVNDINEGGDPSAYLGMTIYDLVEDFNEWRKYEEGLGESPLNINENSNQLITIKATALCFPMLVHEIIKGLYELISLHGFKDDKETNQGVVDTVDKLENEPEDLRYGKFIYDGINNLFANSDYDDPRIREYFLQELYQLDNDTFFNFIDNLINESLSNQQKSWVDSTLKDIYLDLRKDNIDNI